jgi:CRP/FNR family transcriptional regulator, cyclic AMP receptor protein
VPGPSLDVLRGVPLFAQAEDAFLQRLSDEFTTRTYAAGETITEEGEQGRTFLVIDTGEATVTVHGEEVGKLGPGDALGEMALIDKSARSATVTADSEVHAFQLPVWSFRPLIESHPEVVWAFLEAMARRVREAEARGTSGGS